MSPDETQTAPVIQPTNPKTAATLIVPVLVACSVAGALGVYGKLHEPTGIAVNIAGFSSPQTVKVWLATLAFVLASCSCSPRWSMYGKLPAAQTPSWLGGVHRWSGRAGVPRVDPGGAALPVRAGLRRLRHPGAHPLAARLLLLRRVHREDADPAQKGVPGWALPLFGGLVFTALSGLFVTSALWFFTTFGVKF